MDELEQRINHCHTKGMEDEEDYERAAKALGAAPGNKTKKSVASPGGKCTDSATAISCRRRVTERRLLSMYFPLEQETLRSIVNASTSVTLLILVQVLNLQASGFINVFHIEGTDFLHSRYHHALVSSYGDRPSFFHKP